MSTTLLFVALCLSSFRLWRLIGKDDISGGARMKLSGHPWVLKAITCPWCLGSWIALGATFAVHHWLVTLEPHWLLWAVAVAGVVGLLGLIDEKLSD